MRDVTKKFFKQQLKEELNHYSKALKRLKKENEKFKKAEFRYLEFNLNMNFRNWLYIDYDKIINQILEDKNIDDFKVENYNNKKIFDEIINSKKIASDFYISNEILNLIKPKNINDLAFVLACGSGNIGDYIYQFIKKYNLRKSKFINIFKINLILFEEQIKKALFGTFADKNEANFVYKILSDLRYSFDEYTILNNLAKNENFSIISYIKDNNIFKYTHYLKIAYFSFKEAFARKDKKADELFNLLLVGGLISCKKSSAVKAAKKIYKIIYLKKNY